MATRCDTQRRAIVALLPVPLRAKQGDEIGFTASSLAHAALPFLAKLVPNVKFALFLKKEGVECKAPGLRGESTTSVHQLEPIDHISKVSICARAECPGNKDANLKGTVIH